MFSPINVRRGACVVNGLERAQSPASHTGVDVFTFFAWGRATTCANRLISHTARGLAPDMRQRGRLVPRSLASVGRLRYVTRRHDASTHRRRGGWSTRLRSAAGLRRPTRSDLDRGLLGRCRLRRRDHSCHLDVERDRDRPAVRARATLDADRDLGAGRRPAGSELDCRAASAPRSSARLTLPQGWPPNPAAGVHDSSRGNRPLDADLSSGRDRELALSFRVRTGGVL